MAEHPNLGGVSVSLNASIAAIEKNKSAIADLEKKADARQAKLAEEDAKEESRLSRTAERGKKQKAVRSQNVSAAEEESAAIEGADAVRARETAAADASTAAIRRNTAARRDEAAAAQLQARAVNEANAAAARTVAPAPVRYEGDYAAGTRGAFAGASLPPLAYRYQGERAPIDPNYWPASLGPRERQGFLARTFEPPDQYTQRRLYEEQVGKEVAQRAQREPFLRPLTTGQHIQVAVNEAYGLPAPLFGPETDRKRLIEGGIGAQNLATDDPKVFAKYAQRSGWVKAATKARKEATTQAIAEAKTEAKATAAEETKAVEGIGAQDAAAEAAAAADQKRTFKWRSSPRSPGVQRLVDSPYRVSEFSPDAYLLQQKKGRGFDTLGTHPTAHEARLAAHQRLLADEAKTQVTASEQIAAAKKAEADAVVAANEREAASYKLTAAQRRLLLDLPRGAYGSQITPIRRLTEAGLVELTEREGYVHTAEGARLSSELGGTARPRDLKAPPGGGYGIAAAERLAYEEEARRAAAAAPPAPPPPPEPPVAVAPTPEEPPRPRRTVGAALTPEGLYQQDKALVPAEERGLSTVTVSVAQAASVLEGQMKKDAAAVEGSAVAERNLAATTTRLSEARAAPGRLTAADIFGGGGLPPGGGGGGGGGGPKGPTGPVVPPGGGDGPKKLNTAEERAAITEETNLNAVRERSNAILQRQIGAYASSSQALQRHGALTAEFIQALIRGEVTLKEFESQLGVTIGKFAGWAVAGGLVYGVYEGFKKLFEGITQTQSGVEQLKRSLGEKVNVPAAEEAFRKLSQDVNVPIGGPDGSARAVFYAARVFHNQQQAQELAGTTLRAFKLDEVPVQDANKAFGALNVAFRSGPAALKEAFDQLDVGQLKFNARLNQTLPQVGRAAASFAAAGGNQKELIDQIIQINRATGGGGGTGGGNPATALLREPANLTRPESEETLRRFGIDPKWARENIGQFNQYVQELAGGRVKGKPQLAENELQELAKAAGGGAGVGFRYLLPLFRLGQTSLPSEERAATAASKGSAEEDLHHKLSQLDEQFKKLGVDFEIFGSHVGSTGIEHTLGDVVGGINTLVKGAGLLIHPFAALGQTLSNLPDPIRKAVEALALVGGLKLATKSRIGQSVAELAGESSVFLKASGDPESARKVRSVLAAQRKDEELLASEQAALTGQARRKARDVQRATSVVERTREPEAQVAGYNEEELAAYQKRVAAAESRLASAIGAQVANQEESDIITQEQLATNKLIATLSARRVPLEEKILAIREAEAHGVGGGAPTTNPLIYPNERAAAAEDARLRGQTPFPAGEVPAGEAPAATGTVGAGEAGALGGLVAVAATAVAPEAAGLGVAAEEAAAATGGQGLYVAVDAALQRAGAKVGEAASRLKGLGKGVGNFYTHANLLVRGIAAFAAIDIGAELLGGGKDFEKEGSILAGLQAPTTKGELEKRLDESKHTTGESTGDFLHNLTQPHPIAAVESTLHEFFGIGAEHPEYFTADRARQIKREAKAKEALLTSGKLALPGTLKGSEGEEAFQGGEEIHAHELGSDKQETVEGSKKAIEAALKLRLAQLKSFGGTSGEENIRYLARQLAALSSQFVQEGNQTAFEELVQANEAVVSGVIKNAQAKLALADKFLSGPNDKAGNAALASSIGGLDNLVHGLRGGNKQIREELDTAEKNLHRNLAAEAQANTGKGTFSFGSVDKSTAFPQPLLATFAGDTEQHEANEKERKEVQAQRERKEHHEHETRESEKELSVAKAALRLSHVEEGFRIPRAQASLTEAQAGGDKVKRAEIALTLLLEEEKKFAEAFQHDKLNLPALLAKRAEVAAATEAAATTKVEEHSAKLDRQSKLHVAELPAGASAGEKAAIEAGGAASQLAYLQGVKGLSPATKTKLVEEAQITNANAVKSVAESSISESKEITHLHTAIAEANAEGDAEAVAAAAAAGAAAEAAEAKKPGEVLQAHLDAIKAANQQLQAHLNTIASKGALRESTEPNLLEKDKTHLKTLEEEYPLAKKDQKRDLHKEINNEKRKYNTDKANEEIAEIDYREHIGALSQSQTVAELQRVRARLIKAHASRAEIRAIDTKIFDDQQQQGADFGIGDIKLPTLYDARRAQQVGTHTPQEISKAPYLGPPRFEQNVNVTMYVTGANAKEVATHTVHKLKGAVRHAAKKHAKSAGLT